ncbi:IS481 family transposase [Arthrobacter livingstonensis]|uniref:IS481 family transposase n=1 Tax=Arthrobacter livingstonensis TaxID=670078 RepID=A0A2V5L798_9MICC|nr:integrase core domain-containing protein [Arthrobacter livingstonensis]PYI65473.1 IS481 family transposase [Arthrobacter livingstonensis]
MTNSLSPQTRAAIINFDPLQPHALSVTDFCRSIKISRSVFYKIRGRAVHESTAALHPRSRAPKTPARKYDAGVINELVKIRKQLKADGWDYGPRSIYYEASQQEKFPGGKVPSVATIARLLSSVGHVDAAPRKRPKSSYIPFVRATVMSLWQLDAFEYRLAGGEVVTVYQLLDDASRFDVGTVAYSRAENSADAKDVLERAITAYGPPKEVLSDNSLAFNQLRAGRIGSVEIFLASKGTMPISGLPGKPTTQGKNERSHQTLLRFLDAHQPATLEQLQGRISRFRDHYNNRRPHQSLDHATPRTAWDLLEHTPATEPIPLSVLEAKASYYTQVRARRQGDLDRAALTISKTGEILPDENAQDRAADQSVVEITRANRQVYYQGFHVSLPTPYADRQFYRTITDDAFLLTDPATGEIVFSFPLPMVALNVRGRYVASYSVQGVQAAYSTKQWDLKRDHYEDQFAKRHEEQPDVMATR